MPGTLHTPQKLPFALLDGLFDYAGLFPPASLSMPAAVAEYLRHLQGTEARLVGPFVVPVGRLDEAEQAFSGVPASLTVLPRTGSAVLPLLETLREDLEACVLLAGRTSGRLLTRAIELPFPGEAFNDPGQARAWIHGIQTHVKASGLPIESVYLELVRTSAFKSRLDPYFGTLVQSGHGGVSVRGKLRFGGGTPEAYPSPDDVALFIDAACRFGHPFKATAGLHHPFRHQTNVSDVVMHGFVNVFVGAAMHREHGLPMTDLVELIDERDPDAFVMRETGITWRSWHVSTEVLAGTRRELAIGIGSCSIQEPLDDLAHFHILNFPNPT